MRMSTLYLPTYMLDATHYSSIDVMPTSELMEQAGIIRKEIAGVYGYPPIGARITRKIEETLAENFGRYGFQEVRMGMLQNIDEWEKSGRWEKFKDFILSVEGRRKTCLSPTNEETALRMMEDFHPSYKSLPLRIFQIGRKFRGHRSRSGLKNGNEFDMLDAYMFHEKGSLLNESTELAKDAISNSLKAFGLSAYEFDCEDHIDFLYADPYESDRKMLRCSSGHISDYAFPADNCQKCGKEGEIVGFTEIARIQKLGTGLSEMMGISYTDSRDYKNPFEMMCCGIGIGRVLHGIVTKYRDKVGVGWPDALNPFYLAIIPVDPDEHGLIEMNERIQNVLFHGEALIDDRHLSVGKRSRDMDLIGCQKKIVLGKREIESKRVYLESRDGTKESINLVI